MITTLIMLLIVALILYLVCHVVGLFIRSAHRNGEDSRIGRELTKQNVESLAALKTEVDKLVLASISGSISFSRFLRFRQLDCHAA
jgi:hypothetical protein